MITVLDRYKIHPVAARFPLFTDDELADLAQHIKQHGLQQAVVLTADGKTLVDGINRYRACQKADVKPSFRNLPASYTEYDIIMYIIGANMRRRDLNAGQRGMLMLDIAPQLEAEAKQRQRAAGERGKEGGRGKKKPSGSNEPKGSNRVSDQLAALGNVSAATIKRAKRVKGNSPALAADVASGKTSLSEADKTVRQRQKKSPAAGEKEAPSRKMTIVRTHDGREKQVPLPKSAPKFNLTNDQVGWAGWTWNPATGCLHNCDYCYAREGAEVNENLGQYYPFGFTPTLYEHRLDAPKHMTVPEAARAQPHMGRVFVTSMGDLFGKWVPDGWIQKVFAACRANPTWEYLFLTKFPQRYVGLQLPPTAWIGTTVDEQYRVKIAEEAFRKIKGVRLKWLSLEPLLAPLEFSDLSMFDFVVIGSQSATEQPDGKGGTVWVPEQAPPFEWVARLTDQARAAGCKVFQKHNLMGRTDPQHAGMKLIQEVPDLPPLPRAQAELKLVAAE